MSNYVSVRLHVICKASDKKGYQVNIFFLFSTKTYIVGTH